MTAQPARPMLGIVWFNVSVSVRLLLLLSLAAVTFYGMAGVFNLAGLLGVEFRFGAANFTDKDVEVG